MSGRGGYSNGYGYSDASRYERSEGGYGNNTNLGPNGYGAGAGGGSGGRDRRPGGYGGFYPEASQQPSLSPNQSPERRRDRFDRDDRSYSSSRSRTRGPDLDRDRERRPPGGPGNNVPHGDTSRLGNVAGQRSATSAGGTQAVEGMCSAMLCP
jgi:Xaa-Pro aminopeptidase